MYPDANLELQVNKRDQRGFLIPLAIFILVVMGFFAITISRLTGQTAIATAQEELSVASFYAAESGAQLGMNQLYYNTGSAITRTSVDTNCTALSGSVFAFAANGLKGCSATVTCTRSIDGADTTSYYRLQSQASCGSGDVSAQRTIEVSAYMK